MRIGMGYDVHRLVYGRKLLLGGVEIPFERGLLGHSDADVLLHAICDSLLGAAGLGDIGVHFADTDPQWNGVSSLTLLDKCHAMIRAKGFHIANIDATLIMEKPKIGPFRELMVVSIAGALRIEAGAVNIKATTTEGMGFPGRGEGIAAASIALLLTDNPEQQ
jgi:2-C-methyl-D-erythritol 2,4-cyclodiphosphate synthase